MSLALEMATPEDAIRSNDRTLLDLVDGLLGHGVVIRGELWLTVADVDLVFLGLDLLLAAPDKIKPTGIAR